MLPPNPNSNIKFNTDNLKTIYLAGGCFWGTDAYMARIPGVYSTEVGYANGITENPTYKEVCTGLTGHAETVKLSYSEEHTKLDTLLEEFFKTIDPTSLNRQGGDIGPQYRTGIYYTSEAQKDIVEHFIDIKKEAYCKPIAVEILPLECYYIAEGYHQDYLEKNPGGYCHVDLGLLDSE